MQQLQNETKRKRIIKGRKKKHCLRKAEREFKCIMIRSQGSKALEIYNWNKICAQSTVTCPLVSIRKDKKRS